MWNKQKHFRKGNYLWMDGGTGNIIDPYLTNEMIHTNVMKIIV